MRTPIRLLALPLLALLAVGAAGEDAKQPAVGPEEILDLLHAEPAARRETLAAMRADWHPGYTPMLLEVLVFKRDPAARRDLVAALEAGTGQRLGGDVDAWYAWLWSRPAADHPRYAELKSLLYRNIDPAFGGYFANERASTIRLDEVRWGGVRQDGIPPLRGPEMIAAAEATYLADDHVVFGLEIAGDARAYPKRILAWHEMFTDTVGGVAVAGVYCTLCGTVIVFETTDDGTAHRLGTSGFLYRSNKLMYDRATQSLWNTFWGQPVIGPLVGRGIELARHPAVTTTWGEWRRRHPDTRVLALDTGFERDYSEGAAYREYFATDELMFGVPALDRRLPNKAEVLTFVGAGHPPPALAIAARFLAAHPVHHDRLGDVELVVLTDRSGASRAYASDGVGFASWDSDTTAVDTAGTAWRVEEATLVAPDGRRLPRLPASRAFWFGWYAAFPDTRLVGGE